MDGWTNGRPATLSGLLSLVNFDADLIWAWIHSVEKMLKQTLSLVTFSVVLLYFCFIYFNFVICNNLYKYRVTILWKCAMSTFYENRFFSMADVFRSKSWQIKQSVSYLREIKSIVCHLKTNIMKLLKFIFKYSIKWVKVFSK